MTLLNGISSYATKAPKWLTSDKRGRSVETSTHINSKEYIKIYGSNRRLLAIPTSCRRVAAYNPNWG